MIKYNLTRRVAYGTIFRLLSMSIVALALYLFSDLSGAVVGACALSAGVITEGILSKIMTYKIVKELKSSKYTDAASELSYKEIVGFYYPLALTSLLGLGIHPIVTFFLGQSRMSIESLAVLPVINGLVFIFRSVGLSYQEVCIAKMGEKLLNYKPIKNFALISGVSVTLLLVIIAFTPLSDFWFRTVSGLSGELSDFAKTPLKIISIMPGLTFLISFQRAIHVHFRNTKPITHATSLEVFGIISVLITGVFYLDLVGAIAAVSALLVGRIAANLFLNYSMQKTLSKA